MIKLAPLSVEYKVTRYPQPELSADRFLIEAAIGVDEWNTVRAMIWVNATVELIDRLHGDQVIGHELVIGQIKSIECVHPWFVVEPDADWVRSVLRAHMEQEAQRDLDEYAKKNRFQEVEE